MLRYRFIYLSIIYLSISGESCFGRVTYGNYRLLKTTPTTTEQVQKLQELEQSGVDFWSGIQKDKPTEFLVPPGMFDNLTDRLDSWKTGYEIIHENIQTVIDKEMTHLKKRSVQGHATRQSIVETYARYNEINSWLRDMSNQNPEVSTLINIGTTYEGRDMLVIKIGKETVTDKRAVWLDGGIHAREWISPATVIYIIHKLLEGYKKDNEIIQLLSVYDWYILPVANPDGYEYSHEQDRLWRKTRRPTSVKGCIGTDANRNFDYFWSGNGTTSLHEPCSLLYGGERAFSENCTRNLAKFVLSRREELSMFVTLHSFSQLVLLPWGYTTKLPPKFLELMRVGNIGAEAINRVSRRSFGVGTAARTLYTTTGTSLDWAYGTAGIDYVFTFELFPEYSHSTSGFITQQSDIKPSGEEIWAAITDMACAIPTSAANQATARNTNKTCSMTHRPLQTSRALSRHFFQFNQALVITFAVVVGNKV